MLRFAPLLLLASGCLMEVEAEFEDVRVVYPELKLPGVPAEVGTRVSQSFVADDLASIDGLAELIELAGSVELEDAVLHPTGELTTLDFVDQTTVVSSTQSLRAGALNVDLTIDGTLPTEPWTVDVEMWFRGHVHGRVTP